MAGHALSAAHTHHREVKLCHHCHNEMSGDGDYCCIGCEAAHTIAQNAEPRLDVSYVAFVESEGSAHSMTFNVKGIHCASCIQLIENSLHNAEGIESARVNMTTNRLQLSWTGDTANIDDYATIVEQLGYNVSAYLADSTSSEQSYASFLLRCIAVAGFAAGNLMLISVGLWSSSEETMGIATRDLFHWVSACIALPAVIFSGRPFFRSALGALSAGRTNMDVPISLAITLACAMSLHEVITQGTYIYFDSALMLVFFLLIGRYLDERAKGKARSTAEELLSLVHGSTTIIKDGGHETIAIRDIRAGMTVMVAAGERIPADGIIATGSSELDVSMISGETMPHYVSEGAEVFAGTLNLLSPITLTISKASDDSLLSDIVKLMEQAEQGQARYVRLADRAAKLYTPVVHTLGALAFLGWWLVGGIAWQEALMIAITVLIITCPCALGLAVPVVQVLASSLLMKRGILLKSGDALEKLAAIDIAVFDKTGTLTLGTPALVNSSNVDTSMIQLAASIASHSKHPLSQALVASCNGSITNMSDVKEIAGCGLSAEYKGVSYRLGSRAWCGDKDAPSHNGPELWFAIDGKAPVSFLFEDTLREDAVETIATLKRLHITPILLSGDRTEVVEKVAETLQIDGAHASMSPIDKCDYIERLKSQGKKVLMVGDGLNDAPSLAAADVSISPSSAMDISQNTADMVFQGKRLMPIAIATSTARTANHLVKQNFILAVIYNLFAIPIAVAGLVTPLIAALAMSGSSFIVIANSFRLNRKIR